MALNVLRFGQVIQMARLASDPANPEVGFMYYNTTTGQFRQYAGSAWTTTAATEIETDLFRIIDSTVKTKKVAFDVSAVSTATTRTITVPDSNVDLSKVNNALQKDGSVVMTGALDLNSHKITNLTAGSNAGDAVNFTQLGAKADASLIGAASGICELDSSSYVPLARISGLTNSNIAAAAGIVYSKLSISAGDIPQTAVDGLGTALGSKLALAGGTMSGAINMDGNNITGLPSPTLATHPVTLAYFEANSAGLDFLADVNAVQSDATLNPSLVTGSRYIILDAAHLHANFGTINKLMNGSAATLANNDIVQYTGTEFRISWQAAPHTTGGSLTWDNADSVFYNWNATSWEPFGGLTGVTAGVGLTKSGNTLSVLLGSGIGELPTGEVAIDLYSTTSGLMLTVDGSASSSLASAQLAVKVDPTGPISRLTAGLGIKSSSITAGMLAGSITYSLLSLSDGDIPQAKVNGLATSLSGKEPTITAGTTSQYYRGDKSWQTLDTAAVAENASYPYFTTGRVLSTALAGFSSATGGAITSSDTILAAMGKVENRMAVNDAKVGYTAAAARSDVVDNSISSGVTNKAPSQDAVYSALAGKLTSVSADLNPTLGGNLTMNAKSIIGEMLMDGKVGLQDLGQLTLLGSQSSGTVLAAASVVASTTAGVEYEYVCQDESGACRVGRLSVVHDGTNASITDTYNETADVGLSWDAEVSGGSLKIKYITNINSKKINLFRKRFVAFV
jgi:hypothetical protein